jgi:hypothetical protein
MYIRLGRRKKIMSFITRKHLVTLSSIVAVFALSACGMTARTVDTGAELAKETVAATDAVVFGKFRLLRNGNEANLGDGIFANSATLHLYDQGERREIAGKVGKGGEFAWVLAPGQYRISSIGFDNRGERAQTDTEFSFTVAAGKDAVYVGTITLETTFDSGYFGLNGVVDRYTISDDCANDCADRLARLGLASDAATISLLQQEGQLARTN